MIKRYIKTKLAGFTIIELVIVIAIIAVLASISIVAFTGIQQSARNTQRSSRIASVAEALEDYYLKNGEYPTCAMMTQSSAIVVSTVLKGLNPETLTAPLAATGTNSFQCSDPTASTQYGYVGGITSYTLKYKEEGSTNIPLLDSRHHATSPTYTLALTGNHCTPTGAGTFTAGTVTPIGCTAAQFYVFHNNGGQANDGWTGSAGCSAGTNITMDNNKSCSGTAVLDTVALPTPWSPPTVTASSYPSANTTFSWGSPTATCSGGNTIGYRYKYTIPEISYDSGWVETSLTYKDQVNTLDDGYHYTIEAQAHCYNAAGGDSGWTATAQTSVYTATPMCTLTVNSAGNGSASGGGSYDCGYTPATPVISASPNSYYNFSSWTGTGCTGGGSNPATITMTGTKTCTANFTIQVTTPVVSSVWNNGVYSYQVGFSWSGYCSGPATAIEYWGGTYTGGTLTDGWYYYGTATNANSGTMLISGTTYTYHVMARCYHPITGWTGYSSHATANYYRDYWILGKTGTAMGDKYFYYQDDIQRRFKTTNTADTSTHSQVGKDPTHPTYRNLRNPQQEPGVDFSTYPAQSNCKAIGGRLPLLHEIATMAQDLSYYYYGSNPYNMSVGYRTTAQNPDNSLMTYNRRLSDNVSVTSNKDDTNPVRCIRGDYNYV